VRPAASSPLGPPIRQGDDHEPGDKGIARFTAHIGIAPNFFLGGISPHIDWGVTITLIRNNSTGVTSYGVAGTHDGFPFHEIRINSTQVYARDPIPNGDTPVSLYDPPEITVSVGGNLP
jgi:hypothetical protein